MVKSPLKFPNDLSSECLQELGKLVVVYNFLESQFRNLLGGLITDSQRVAQILGTGISFKKLRSIISSLFQEKLGKGESFEQLRYLLKSAATFEEKRNNIFHSDWRPHHEEGKIHAIKVRASEKQGVNFSFELYDVERLYSLNREIYKLGYDVHMFVMELTSEGKLHNPQFTRESP